MKLTWDKVGERLYETGTDHGVLWTSAGNGLWNAGVPWNGLTGVTESPTGAEATPLWADNIKYLNLISTEEYAATIEAFMYPDAFAACNGEVELVPGVAVGQQDRKPFCFSWRTILGNDTDMNNHGYKLHIVYNGTVAPSEKAYSTVNDSPEGVTFSWEVSTTPVNVTGGKPTASLTIDSTKVNADQLKELEDKLYGTDSSDSVLLLPDEIAQIFSTTSVTLDKTSVVLTVGGSTDKVTATTIPAGQSVTWSSADTSVATVSGGTITPVGAGTTNVTAKITVSGVDYTANVVVRVNAA